MLLRTWIKSFLQHPFNLQCTWSAAEIFVWWVFFFYPSFPSNVFNLSESLHVFNSSMNNCTAELSVAVKSALCCFYSHVTEQVLSALSRKQIIAEVQQFFFFLVSVSGLSLCSSNMSASTRQLRMSLMWYILQLHFCCAVKQLHSGFRIWSYWMDVSFWIL